MKHKCVLELVYTLISKNQRNFLLLNRTEYSVCAIYLVITITSMRITLKSFYFVSKEDRIKLIH